MALLRKFLSKKLPDNLVWIFERIYVFDCCFSTGPWEQDYKAYIGKVITKYQEMYPESYIMILDFREADKESWIASALSGQLEHIVIMDYPRNYEGCPVLSLEVIHHFLKSIESWLTVSQNNILIMHSELGGWPVLAFMAAALSLYRKYFSVESKALNVVYRQAPNDALHRMSPMNPQPSQLRYLQYVSRRNADSEWPPADKALKLDCVIMRTIPDFDGKGGCSPIFRIYGRDPLLHVDKTPKHLFSTPRRRKNIRYYNQADDKLMKIDINCHIQGDVVLECIDLHDDMEKEKIMYRAMFNTAFIRSNALILNRDEIDINWETKDKFQKDFIAEVAITKDMDVDWMLNSVRLVRWKADKKRDDKKKVGWVPPVDDVVTENQDEDHGDGVDYDDENQRVRAKKFKKRVKKLEDEARLIRFEMRKIREDVEKTRDMVAAIVKHLKVPFLAVGGTSNAGEAMDVDDG